MSTVLGLDIGHSAVKMVVLGEKPLRECFPSIVCPATRLTTEAQAVKAAAETVRVDGLDYFFGDTALKQRDQQLSSDIGLHDNWVTSSPYEVLLRGAIQKAEQAGNAIDDMIIVHGLPAVLFNEQKVQVEALHKKVCPQAYCVVMAQPMGVFYGHMLGRRGEPLRGDEALDESWAFIDVGHYSTDFMLNKEGDWIQKASGSCKGISRITIDLANSLKARGISRTPTEYQAFLQKGKNADGAWIQTYFTKPIDVTDEVNKAIEYLAKDVVDQATTLLGPYAHDLNGIIVAGGGATLLSPFLKKIWPHVVAAEDGRLAVAEGFARYGAMIMASRTEVA